MSNNIETTLKQRQCRYGDFPENARISQEMKRVMQTSRNWSALTNDKREALEMIAHKIGRILNGDPEYHLTNQLSLRKEVRKKNPNNQSNRLVKSLGNIC